MQEQIIRISPDGTQVRFLCGGDDPLLGLGEVESMVRAARVEFDNDAKCWRVIFRLEHLDGQISEAVSQTPYATREAALAREKEWGNMILEKNPDMIDRLIRVHLDENVSSG